MDFQQKGLFPLNQRTTFHLSCWVRLVALSLLLGFGLVTGNVLASRTAHAQSLSSVTITDCTDETQLRGAIANAASGETITFGCSGAIPINALNGPLTIATNLTLDGSGQTVTLDGGNRGPVLSVNGGVTFTLNALTIAHGYSRYGGGILNGGTVNISNSTFANNAATFENDGFGGGILNEGGATVSISNSTFANNTATNGGGLINGGGTVSISNSTFANNAASYGGGLINDGGTVSISNSTFANNAGGGLSTYDGGTTSIGGSIVVDNTGGNCTGGVSDQGYNLESSTDCGFTGTGDLQNTDPRLDPNGLQNNGGPTQTIALLSTSPAIDHIPTTIPDACPATDQRGNPRPDGTSENTCDIGAYESNYPPDNDLALTNIPTTITTNATSSQGAVVTYSLPTVVDEDSPLPAASCTPASGATFAIGTTTVTCTVSDSDDINSPVSQSFSVVVQPTLTVSVASVNATEGSAFSGVVATGTAYGTSNPLSAGINWGDGNSSTGSVTLNPDGSYSISGSHTYAEEGSYALSVTVNDSGNLSAKGNGSATVADAALTLTHFAAGQLGHQAAGLSAVFTDADPNGQVSDYTATINWGDGTTATVKVVKNPLGKGFVLAGVHQYAKKGVYTLTLTVSDSGGSQFTKAVTITVK